MRVGNSLFSDPDILSCQAIDFYAKLFYAFDYDNVVEFWIIDEAIPSIVSCQDNLKLMVIPNSIKIKNVVISLIANSALGPNLYFRHCWDVGGMDVIDASRAFFIFGQIHTCLNSNLMVLLSKVDGLDCIE